MNFEYEGDEDFIPDSLPYKSDLTLEEETRLSALFARLASERLGGELLDEDYERRKKIAGEYRNLVGGDFSRFARINGLDKVTIRAYFFGFLEPREMEPITEALKKISGRPKD